MSEGDPKNPVDLSPVGAKEYKERIAAAKDGHVPVGGAPPPKIPRLDQPPPGAPRDRGMGVQQAQEQQAAVQGGMRAMKAEEYARAVQEGRAVQGVGGAYVGNQPIPQSPPPTEQTPEGVLEGKDGNPVNPPRPEGGLREETAAQLAEVMKANAPAEESPPDEDDEDDEFFEEFGKAAEDILSNKKRRKVIEGKIENELSFEDLISNQELRQEVPILKNFRPVFRTPSGAEDLFVKRKIGDERSGSERYIVDKYAVMGLCCGLHAINGQPLPDHLDSEGNPDNAKFDKKLKVLMKYPLVILADLSANFTWFTERVQSLLAIDKVKDF